VAAGDLVASIEEAMAFAERERTPPAQIAPPS
jgi:hypothetical protein